jgi:hypothetical protein
MREKITQKLDSSLMPGEHPVRITALTGSFLISHHQGFPSSVKTDLICSAHRDDLHWARALQDGGGWLRMRTTSSLLVLCSRLTHFDAPVDQALDGSPVNEVLLNDGRNILGLHFGVPNALRINDHRRTPGMLPRAAGASHQNILRKLPAIHFAAKALEKF